MMDLSRVPGPALSDCRRNGAKRVQNSPTSKFWYRPARFVKISIRPNRAASGPRKGSNPPAKQLQTVRDLTSSPRDADAGPEWKEGTYVQVSTSRTRVARISQETRQGSIARAAPA